MTIKILNIEASKLIVFTFLFIKGNMASPPFITYHGVQIRNYKRHIFKSF